MEQKGIKHKESNRRERARQADAASWLLSLGLHLLVLLAIVFLGGVGGLLSAGARAPMEIEVGIVGAPMTEQVDETQKPEVEPQQELDEPREAQAEEAQRRAEEAAQRRAEEEAAQRRAEDAARRQADEAAAVRRAQEEEQQRLEAERRRAEEEAARRQAEEAEARRRAEEEAARRRAEEEARRQAEEAARRAAEEEARRLEELARRPGGAQNPFAYGGGGAVPVGLDQLPKNLANELGYTYAGETKIVALKFEVVARDGGFAMRGEPIVLASSGIPALDQEAVRRAKAAAFDKPGWWTVTYSFNL